MDIYFSISNVYKSIKRCRNPDKRKRDGDESGRQTPDRVEQRDVRAEGGHEEEAEGDAADLQVLPQRVGDVGPPDRPREPHDRRAPASAVRFRPAVPVPVPVVRVAVVMVMVVVVVVVAVGAGGEGEGAARGEEERGFGGQG